MRAFLAFPLPEKIKTAVSPFLEEGKRLYPDIKWVEPLNLHITLFFFGEIDEALAEWTGTIIGEFVKTVRPFSAAFAGLGSFPPKGKPRVIFTPLTEGGESSVEIHESLYSRLQRKHNLKMRKFSPHITLGRVRKGKKQGPLQIERFQNIPEGRFTIDRIVLYQSVLHSTGPVYNEISSFAVPG